MEYNIYCDESCHLEHDDIKVMQMKSKKPHSILQGFDFHAPQLRLELRTP